MFPGLLFFDSLASPPDGLSLDSTRRFGSGNLDPLSFPTPWERQRP